MIWLALFITRIVIVTLADEFDLLKSFKINVFGKLVFDLQKLVNFVG